MTFANLFKDKLRELRFGRDPMSKPETPIEILAGHALCVDINLDTHWQHIRRLEAAMLLVTNQSYYVDKKLPEILTSLVNYLEANANKDMDTKLFYLLNDLRIALGR